MTRKNKDTLETWVRLLVAVLAIVAIKSIFEDDNSKIVSKNGLKYLSDEGKMKDLNKKILKSENENQHQEIIL
jgi:hypothetical protein